MADVSTTVSGLTGAGGGDKLRITGMASGLDVDATVKKMLTADQVRIDKAKQNLQITQWKKDMYSDIFTDLKDLQNTFFNSLSDNNLLSTGAYSAFDISGTDDSVATASGGAGAVSGTYKVKVDQIATGASMSGSSLNTMAKIDAASWVNKDIMFNNITISTGATATAEDIVKNINSGICNNTELNGKVSASLVTLSTGEKFVKFNALSNTPIKITDTNIVDMDGLKGKDITNIASYTKLTDLGVSNSSLTMNINAGGKDYSVTLDNSGGSRTIKDFINAVSQGTSGKVAAEFDDITGKITFTNNDKGSTSTIAIKKTVDGNETTDSLIKGLGLTTDPANPSDSSKYVHGVNGQNSIVTVTSSDGSSITTTQTSNSVKVGNVNYTLNKKGDTDITVKPDADATVKKMTDFIDKYNKVVDKINEKLTDKKNLKYKPLTDSQKKGMSTDEIKKWDDEAKKGLLKGDNNLQDLMFTIRRSFYEKVESAGITFGKNGIGIDTNDDTKKPGRIEFVESVKDSAGNLVSGKDYFKQMVRDHGDEIVTLFTKTSDGTENPADTTKEQKSITKYKNEGIFQRIGDTLKEYIGSAGTTINSSIMSTLINKQYDYSTTGTSGKNTFPDQIYSQNQIIKAFTDKLNAHQTKYYEQFSKLETAMNKLNSQSSWLSQQLGTN